jgi:hypothetical protein
MIRGTLNFLATCPSLNSVSCLSYFKISLINLIKTLFRTIIAFLDSCFHNFFSFKAKNGQWHKYNEGKIFELERASAEVFVGLVGYSKKTISTKIEILAVDVSNIIKAHLSKLEGFSANVILIGHSMGGSVALQAARLLKEKNIKIRVITVFSPHEGTNLLKWKKYQDTTFYRNFHPKSPFLFDISGYFIDLTRIVAANDHVIPRTKEEIESLKNAGCHITDDGHNTFAQNPKTVALIKGIIFSKHKPYPTHIFCLHGLNGTLGGMYRLAQRLNN